MIMFCFYYTTIPQHRFFAINSQRARSLGNDL